MHQGNVTPIIKHASKPRIAQRASAGGILFTMRSGAAAYIEHGGPFALEYLPGTDGGQESIQCRMGDSFITVAGKNLWPLFEEMQTRKRDAVQESDQDQAALGVLYVESITVRLWL
jgi:hypothetical protein